MATFTTQARTYTAGTGLRACAKHGIVYEDVTINFPDFATAADPPDDTDVINICEVPIGVEVVSVACNVVTATSDAAAVTFNVGITGGDTNAFLPAVDFKVTGKSYPPVTNEAVVYDFKAAGMATGAERMIAMVIANGTDIITGKIVFRIALRDVFA